MRQTPGGCVFLSCLLLTNLLSAGALQEPQAAAAPPAKLNIVVIEGEGALNNIKQRVNREPIVEVQDENHKPVAGAAVIFFLPTSGPSGTFPNGTQTFTVTTDSVGRAAATGIRPNHQTGKMQIRVTASANGQTAGAIITQANIAGANVSRGLSNTTKLLIVGGVVVAVAAGVFFAVRKTGPATSQNITIAPGIPAVGAPQ